MKWWVWCCLIVLAYAGGVVSAAMVTGPIKAERDALKSEILDLRKKLASFIAGKEDKDAGAH